MDMYVVVYTEGDFFERVTIVVGPFMDPANAQRVAENREGAIVTTLDSVEGYAQ